MGRIEQLRKYVRNRMHYKNRRPYWILFFIALLAAAGILGNRIVLLKNANQMGKNLVQSYAMDEESSIALYENMVRIGMSYVNDQVEEGESEKTVEEWITRYFAKTRESMNGNVADAYAVLNGKVIADLPWEGIEEYDYANAAWYRQAMKAEGKVIFTNAYKDSVYGKQVITIAAADPGTGNAVAYDLFPENFQKNHRDLKLMESSSYYVCDAVGGVLYYRTAFDASEESIKTFVEQLYGRIDSGEINENDNMIKDVTGKKRYVYYYRAQNGWLCILTIPLGDLYENLYEVNILYLVIAVVLCTIIVLVWLRDFRMRKYINDRNDTIHMLGNSYYAIYRINIHDDTYEIIKGSEYVIERLPCRGRYEELLDVLISCMNEDTKNDFAKSFSLENIISLADKNTRDYGGDFLRLFDGEYRWVSVRLVQEPENSPGEAVLCFREVEEEKERQLQSIRILEDALAAADASEKSQKQFFSSMSHDMRTPLNAIIGMADLALRKDCSRETVENYLAKISVSGKQLLALINEILEMSRLEQGKVDLENSIFNLCDVLEACVSPFEIQAGNERKQFEVRMNVTSPTVCGDSSRLTQILNNLVSNAVKYTEEGDRITVTLNQMKQSRHSRYEFIIEDTGAGMSEEFLPKLYEPYEREKRFGAKNVAGTGLGMPIVKNLVSQLGGEITVDSKLGVGTRFRVILPFSVSRLDELPEEETREEKEPGYDSLKGKRILLAEDNELNMEIVTELLEMKGIVITPARNGREAVEQFLESEEYFFDAILMDMQMPEMDGCEATVEIRSLERGDAKEIPIIALTANAFPEDIARTAAAGMNIHLSKPIDPELLWTTLQQLIS